MKCFKLFILLLLSSFLVKSQGTQIGNLSINHSFTESFSSQGGTEILCVDNNYFETIAAAVFPKKSISSCLQYNCGDMWVYNTDLTWGNPFVWQKVFRGTIHPYQLKNLKFSNITIIVGFFTDSIRINNNVHYRIDSNTTSSFIIALNSTTGDLKWIRTIDTISNSRATSVTELSSGNILVSTFENGYSASILKINPYNGTVLDVKHFPTIRTLSSMLELNNTIYVAGTIDNTASIDSFLVQTNKFGGNANYMFKADTNLQLTFLAVEPYSKYDFTNYLSKGSNSILWSFYKGEKHSETTQSFNLYREIDTLIQRLDLDYEFSFSEYHNRLVIPLDVGGYLLFKNDFTDVKLYYLNFGSISYYESVMYGTSIHVLSASTSYTNTVITGMYSSTNLNILGIQLPNPYDSANQSNDFMSFYHEIFGGIEGENRHKIKSFPNPAIEEINIVADDVQYVSIMNLQGQLMNTYYSTNKIDIHQLPSGLYLMNGYTTDKYFTLKFIKK